MRTRTPEGWLQTRWGAAVRLAGVIALAAGCSGSAGAAEPEAGPGELPRTPATAVEAAAGTFRVRPGFRLELAAAEPVVVSPVAVSFDEEGRLYVVEMRDYSERRPERLGRVRRLEDADGDGRFEKGTVFAGDLPWPTAVACWEGGVFVGVTPDILYLKDTDGDGVADVREPVFTGFASEYAPFATNQLNVQALLNSFQWTLENRLHGAASFSGGKVRRVDSPFVRAWLARSGGGAGRGAGPVELRGRDFSFDPRRLDLRAESGGGQHGMSFDAAGRKFVCSNSDHLQQVLPVEGEGPGGGAWSVLPLPPARVSIAADGPAAEVYRISPEEPWRVLRTRWRVSGQVKGPIEGGGRASGYFTGATGVTLYRGDAYGPEYRDAAFIGDAGGNLVHRKQLRPDGLRRRGDRADDESRSEFLASTDTWFRPVQLANGPDGCLLVVDMYREVIEHPWSLPAGIKKHLDLNSGSARGRIWRVVPEGFRRPPAPRLGRLGTAEWVALLGHANGWTRDTAARLLHERQDPAAAPALRALLAQPPAPDVPAEGRHLGVLHALSALAGQGRLTSADVIPWLGTNLGAAAWGFSAEGREAVAVQALRRAGPLLAELPESWREVLRGHAELAGAARVPSSWGLQFVLTLGSWPGPGRAAVLRRFWDAQFAAGKGLGPAEAAIAERDLAWLVPALVNSLGSERMDFLEGLAAGPPGSMWAPAEQAGLGALARAIGVGGPGPEVRRVVAMARARPLSARAALMVGLQQGLQQGGHSLARAVDGPDWQAMLRESLTNATLPGLTLRAFEEPRVASIRLLGLADQPDVRSNLLWMAVQPKALPVYRREALQALEAAAGGSFGAEVLRAWPQLAPDMRAEVLPRLLRRPAWTRLLLEGMRAGGVPRGELSPAQVAALRSHADGSVRALAQAVLGKADPASRAGVVEAYQPALALAGRAGAGEPIFQARCATCHRAGAVGQAVGPDLATLRGGGREKLLLGILDPNREVAPNFAAYTAETRDGESLTGVLVAQGEDGVTLRLAGGAEVTVARSNLAALQGPGRSLMPEGLEAGLTAQDLADLMEFILAPGNR
ncbi:MAG: hypothetical protein RJA22_1917 [Verrucomicrobiota bacterium]